MSNVETKVSKLSEPRIVCAASIYRLVDGRQILVPGPRHNSQTMIDVLVAIEPDRQRRQAREDVYEGFIDQHGQFYDRLAAWHIAEKNNQIFRRVGGDGPDQGGLYSENLY